MGAGNGVMEDDMKLAVVSFAWASRQILDTFDKTASSARHELPGFQRFRRSDSVAVGSAISVGTTMIWAFGWTSAGCT